MDERIEQYFEASLSSRQKQQFEQDLESQPDLLDDVAFYLKSKTAAQQVARDNRLKQKHENWSANLAKHKIKAQVLVWMAIAASLLIVMAVLFYFNPFRPALSEKASNYLAQNLSILPVHLGADQGDLQQAIKQYNLKDYTLALKTAGAYLNVHENDPEGLMIMGLAHLQLKNYAQALAYFHSLSAQTNLYDNPGKFYEALCYLSRNTGSDAQMGRRLLEEVVQGNQSGKKEALKWLDKTD